MEINYLLFTQRVVVGLTSMPGYVTASADGDLMNAASWKKSAQPVFKQSMERKVFAPGHNSFFKSPDGKEDWILYHANSEPGQGCGKHRSPRAQKFTWNANGTPYFGEPVKVGMVEVPSNKMKPKDFPSNHDITMAKEGTETTVVWVFEQKFNPNAK
jgi:hypothetical protein